MVRLYWKPICLILKASWTVHTRLLSYLFLCICYCIVVCFCIVSRCWHNVLHNTGFMVVSDQNWNNNTTQIESTNTEWYSIISTIFLVWISLWEFAEHLQNICRTFAEHLRNICKTFAEHLQHIIFSVLLHLHMLQMCSYFHVI